MFQASIVFNSSFICTGHSVSPRYFCWFCKFSFFIFLDWLHFSRIVVTSTRCFPNLFWAKWVTLKVKVKQGTYLKTKVCSIVLKYNQYKDSSKGRRQLVDPGAEHQHQSDHCGRARWTGETIIIIHKTCKLLQTVACDLCGDCKLLLGKMNWLENHHYL